MLVEDIQHSSFGSAEVLGDPLTHGHQADYTLQNSFPEVFPDLEQLGEVWSM